jgi:hypothetical protein
LLCSVFTLGLIVSCKGGVASEEAEEESAEETTGYIDVTPEEAKDLIPGILPCRQCRYIRSIEAD